MGPLSVRHLSVWFSLIATGCISYSVKTPVRLTNMVAFDDKGRAMDPTGNVCPKKLPTPSLTTAETEFHPCNGHFNRLRSYRELNNEFTPYMDNLFRELDRYARSQQRRNPANGHLVKRVILFVHGGLNSPKDTIDRTYDLSNEIMHDKFDAYFPIFINWQSSLPSSWLDHILFVRNGQWFGTKGLLQAPFYLASDAARAIGRAPIAWNSEVAAAEDSIALKFKPEETMENLNYCELRKGYDGENHSGPGVISISKGQDVHTRVEGAIATTKWLLMSPLKFADSPLLDAVGSSAWSVMERRTRLLFHDDPEEGTCCSTEPTGNGGLAIFLRELQRRIADGDCRTATDPGECVDWELTLVAHSAGALVANGMLRSFPDIHFSRIVYMAAACSIRDYEESVWPYMRLMQNQDTRFYHLTLHDFAEVREVTLLDIPPRGSLLVWIDDLFSDPLTPRDRTAGRFRNLMRAISSTPAELRSRISIKTFGVGDALKKNCPSASGATGSCCPQHHGDFSSALFWREAFWKPEGPCSKDVDSKACREESVCQ